MTQTDPKYWFKRRRYGWGWTPVTWQGWLSLILSFAAPVAVGLWLHPYLDEQQMIGASYVLAIVTLTVLVAISSRKGPPPRWRGGKKPSDNPDEDF